MKSELEKFHLYFERLETDPIVDVRHYPKRLKVQKVVRTVKKKIKR